jgi:PDZ domain-containing protein
MAADEHSIVRGPSSIVQSLSSVLGLPSPLHRPPPIVNCLPSTCICGSSKLQILREGNQMEVTVPLMQPAAPGGSPRIGITIESAGVDANLPFLVRIMPDKIAGGPSAGLMFTLTVYDAVTPKDLTMGRVIAGIGTIDLDGTVGPIGGVKQKVAAAEGAGAQYFLSPPENY